MSSSKFPVISLNGEIVSVFDDDDDESTDDEMEALLNARRRRYDRLNTDDTRSTAVRDVSELNASLQEALRWRASRLGSTNENENQELEEIVRQELLELEGMEESWSRSFPNASTNSAVPAPTVTNIFMKPEPVSSTNTSTEVKNTNTDISCNLLTKRAFEQGQTPKKNDNNKNKIPRLLGIPSLPIDFKKVANEHLDMVDKAETILRDGISMNLNASEVIDKVVLYLSVIKGSIKLQDCTGSDPMNRPLDVSRDVIEIIGNVVGEWRNFFSDNCALKLMKQEILRAKLMKGEFSRTSRTTDTEVFTRFKPMELVGQMITFILLEIIHGDFNDALHMVGRLHIILQDPKIYKKQVYEPVYKYLQGSIKLLKKTLLFLDASKFLQPENFPSDENWSEELLQNRFLIWHFVEASLNSNRNCSNLIDDVLKRDDIMDVEWLLTVANSLREKRLRSPCSKNISEVEIKLVKKALRYNEENPFAVLALLKILSDRSDKVSPDFEMKCRSGNIKKILLTFSHIMRQVGTCATILIQIAKFFVKPGRNRKVAYDCLRSVLSAQPRHAEANYLCARYLCGSNGNINIGGPAQKDRFLHDAMTSDLSNFEVVFEYFKTALPRPLISLDGSPLYDYLVERTVSASSSAVFTSLSGSSVACLTYTDTVDLIISSMYSKGWTSTQKALLKFLSSLNYYFKNEKSRALEIVMTFYDNNHVISMIRNLNNLCDKYKWDRSRLGYDKYREWLEEEYDTILADIRAMEAEHHGEIESIDSEDEVEDGDVVSENDDDDYETHRNEDSRIEDYPQKEMLSYLLRLL